jgi:hypothetical protein
MIWLAWRQFRTQALIASGLLVVLAFVLAIDGNHLVHLYDTTVASCARHNDCASAIGHFTDETKWHTAADLLLLAVPALLGAFWGGPLVARELESRTNLLVWTQSVTRSRWFMVKVAITGSASMVTAGLLSVMVTWWSSPHDRLTNSPYSVFDKRDIVPVGYALLAFAIGVLFGTVMRRSLPAVASTLAAFAVIRIGFTMWVRPRILPPLHALGVFELPSATSVIATPHGFGSRDWLFSETVVNSAGRVVAWYNLASNGAISGFDLPPGDAFRTNAIGKCVNLNSSPTGTATAAMQAAAQRCVDRLHLHTLATYLPSSRFWMLQWSETALFVASAIAILAFALWWVRKRVA